MVLCGELCPLANSQSLDQPFVLTLRFVLDGKNLPDLCPRAVMEIENGQAGHSMKTVKQKTHIGATAVCMSLGHVLPFTDTLAAREAGRRAFCHPQKRSMVAAQA